MHIFGEVRTDLQKILRNRRRQHSATILSSAGMILVWLILLVLGFQVTVIARMFDEKDAKEATPAGLGLPLAHLKLSGASCQSPTL